MGVQVWDLESHQLLYQSSVLGAAAPTSLAVDPHTHWLAVGFANSTVRLFDLMLLPTCREKEV
jgi:WD40 repeat protein